MANLHIVYFSPTGSTKRVLEYLAGESGGGFLAHDITPFSSVSELTFTADDLVFIGAPSFGGRLPKPASERLSKMRGCGARAVLITTFGNRKFEDSLIELKDVVESAGFVAVAAAGVVTEHSIVREFGLGRPDDVDKAELTAFARRVSDRLRMGGAFELSVEGNVPYKELKVLPLHPHADERCVMCAVCAAVCPVAAIPLIAPQETDDELCISCMGCVSVCPEHARDLPPETLAFMKGKLEAVCSSRKENEFFI